ncbi:phosphoribosyltransferase-like protein [Bisporella sp. PMI_857]|nr:phosphoribosyltransferase-like protein [Bisporella sp. PMI_857]
MGDSELMLEIILSQCPASCQSKVSGASVPNWIVAGLEEVYRLCSGSFACYGLVAFRDANGIKPLVMGERRTEDGEIDYMFASESVAFRSLGYTLVRDIRPGEAIFIPNASSYTGDPRDISKQIVPELSHSPDIFEYVYFARTESIIDGISVNASRKFMGEALARTLMAELSAKDKFALTEIDCVIPVPETSFTCALALSQYLRKPLSLGLVRNRFIFRTFMLPNQKQRAKAVNRKLNVIQEEFEGKNVLIVDDSIVRGTTSTQIVKMARDAGAKKVYLASGSPAIRFKHIHGIDLADESKLIAHGRSNSQIRDFIGCDQLFYLPLEELLKACISARCYDDVSSFEVGVFNGSYTTDMLTC